MPSKHSSKPSPKFVESISGLSPREQDVARRIVIGDDKHHSAKRMGISIKTFDTHRGNLMSKLGVKSNVQLLIRALREKFISLPELGVNHEEVANG